MRLTLSDLVKAVQSASRSSRELDAQIEVAMRWLEAARLGLRPDVRAPWAARINGEVYDPWVTYSSLPITGSVDAAARLVTRMLPGWWWKVGTCCVSDDACIAPDFNSPMHGERLLKQFQQVVPRDEFDTGFDVDRRPPGNVSLALCEALLRALIAVEEYEARKEPAPCA